MTIALNYIDKRNNKSLLVLCYSYSSAIGSIGVMTSVGFELVRCNIIEEVIHIPFERRLRNYIPHCYEG